MDLYYDLANVKPKMTLESGMDEETTFHNDHSHNSMDFDPLCNVNI